MNAPVDEYLEHFSPDSEEVSAVEHGLGSLYLAPYVGQNFEGRSGVREYFGWKREIVKTISLRFEDYIVDVEAGVVSVRCRGRFLWRETQNEWEEVSTARMSFNERNLVTKFEYWGDTGAAFLASRGKLRK
jgi:hypothetical protein